MNKEDIAYRPAMPADLDEVLSLNESHLPHVGSVTRKILGSFLNQAASFEVALADRSIAGFCVAFDPNAKYTSPNFLWFCDRYPNFLYIDRIVVAPWARRRGIATGFYSRLEGFAANRSIPILTCEYNLNPPNENSRIFHSRYGFVEAGRQDTENGMKTVSLQFLEVSPP
ncbi:MAG: GNAT family N-acetyltransferase [Desulfovibrionales bacterium]